LQRLGLFWKMSGFKCSAAAAQENSSGSKEPELFSEASISGRYKAVRPA